MKKDNAKRSIYFYNATGKLKVVYVGETFNSKDGHKQIKFNQRAFPFETYNLDRELAHQTMGFFRVSATSKTG